MAGIQTMQEFIPVRTPTANGDLSEGMLSWSLVLPPVTNIIGLVAAQRRGQHPVRYTRIAEPFLSVGGGSLLPKDFQLSEVNPTPPADNPGTSGQTGQPTTTGGTTATAPVPVGSGLGGDVPIAYAVYVFKPTVTSSVASVTQIGSVVISLSYYLPDWTFAIWIPSLQRYIEYVPTAPSLVPQKWVTINAATNLEASGGASIEFIFGQRQAQTTDLTAPYGSILVNNYKVSEHLFVAGLGGGDGGNGSGGTVPAAGIAVSDGSAWASSIPVNSVATTSQLANYLPLAGGTIQGTNRVNFGGAYGWIAGTSAAGDVEIGLNNNFIFRPWNTSSAIYRIFWDSPNNTYRGLYYVPLTLAADPAQALEAATKQYVDNSIVNARTPVILPNNTDLNTAIGSSFIWAVWYGTNVPAAVNTDLFYGETIQMPGGAYILQRCWAGRVAASPMYTRLYTDGAWGAWMTTAATPA